MTKKPDDLEIDLGPDPLEDALRAELEAKFSMLTPAEIETARQTARDRVAAKSKKAALEEVIAAETRLLELKTGDGYKDEEIWVTIDLAPYSDRLVIDGTVYLQGHTYKLPRHMVNSMRESMMRSWDHEADIKGESLRQKLGQYRAKNFGTLEGSHTTAGAPVLSGRVAA
jgi:hypothetical protein